jgi:hypothetical protein
MAPSKSREYIVGYRLFFLNAENRVVWREEFEAATDVEALAEGLRMFMEKPEYPACELWQEKRRLHRQEC